jgi:hypothetical protein
MLKDLAIINEAPMNQEKTQLLVWTSAEALTMMVMLDAVLLNWKIKMKIDCIIANQ